MTRIPFLRPNLARLEKFEQHLRSLEESRWYSNFGPLNTLFEERIRAECFGGTGAVATVNNATTGLMLAMALMKRSGGRYAVMPSFTFPATPLAAMWAGLEPYFVDVEMETFAVGEQSLRRAVSELGDQIAVVVPYATFGYPIDLEPYARLMREGIPVVIDAAPGLGTTCGGSPFGARFPGAIVFSLHATKAFGIGEGGVVYSGDAGLIGRVREASNFGFGADKVCRFQGLNGKLPEFAAAVGLATLDEFPDKKTTRMKIYGWYREEIGRLGMPERGWAMQRAGGEIPHQFFPLLCPAGRSNLELERGLAALGIDIRTYFCPPCHRQPAFETFPRHALPNTEALSTRALSLPLWDEMSREQVATVVNALAG